MSYFAKSLQQNSILCTSLVHDRIPWAGLGNCAVSRGGVSILMKTMAQELAQDKIRVDAISPGAIETPINATAWNTPEALKERFKLIPYGRVGVGEAIAKAALWLASDESDDVTGATRYVDGGMVLYPGFRTGG